MRDVRPMAGEGYGLGGREGRGFAVTGEGVGYAIEGHGFAAGEGVGYV